MEPSKQELPPPYSATAYGVDQNFGINYGGPTAPSAPAPAPVSTLLDHLSQILCGHEELILHSTSRIGFGTSTLMVQLQDSHGQPVMSTLYTPGPSVSHGGDSDNTIRIGGTTKFMDTTGKALLTAQENGRSLTVYSGDTTLGVVEGFGIFVQNIVAKNILAQVVLRVVSEGNQFKFILANGTEVGKFSKNSQGRTSLSFSQSLDPQTKALVLATAHILYLHYYVPTMFGSGQRGLLRKFCLCSIMILFIPIIIFLIVFLSI